MKNVHAKFLLQMLNVIFFFYFVFRSNDYILKEILTKFRRFPSILLCIFSSKKWWISFLTDCITKIKMYTNLLHSVENRSNFTNKANKCNYEIHHSSLAPVNPEKFSICQAFNPWSSKINWFKTDNWTPQ